MTSNDGYAHKVDVTVNNGKFISTNGYAVYEGIPNKEGTSNPIASKSYVTLAINGGEFIGNSGKSSIKLNSISNKKFITGGSFNSNPSDYLASENYESKANGNGTWTVIKK